MTEIDMVVTWAPPALTCRKDVISGLKNTQRGEEEGSRGGA